VDEGVRAQVLARLKEAGVDVNNPDANIEKLLFETDPITKTIKTKVFMPNKNGPPVPVRKVRVAQNLGTAEQLPGTVRNRWVKPGDNYGVAIYEDSKGDYYLRTISFWSAVQLGKNDQPAFALLHPQWGKLVETLSKGELFLLELHPDEVEWNNQALLSQHLYRVQAISGNEKSPDIEFYHHLIAKTKIPQAELRIKSFKRWRKLTPIKVLINTLGSIQRA
jgi:CRISPR-associated endonuclease Csn1